MENINYAVEEFKNSTFKKSNGLMGNRAVSRVYPYTNETLRQFVHLLNIKDGRVATVGSSGDQAFYAIYFDASEITLIDGNPYAKPFVELKRSAIKNMKLKEFLDYWRVGKVLDKRNYEYLLGDCSKETVDFFREMESFGSPKKKAKYFFDDRFFNLFESSFKGIPYSIACEFYDNEEKFSKLKNKLEYNKINFELAALKDFPKVLNGEYSTIMLSNIYDYYLNSDEYIDTCNTLIDNNLIKNGTMQTYYMIGEGYYYEQSLSENDNLNRSNIKSYKVERLLELPRYKKNPELDFSDKYPIEKSFFGDKKLREEIVYIYEKE